MAVAPSRLRGLFTSRENKKVTVRVQNNNKFKLGLAWRQAVCHILFTSRDRLRAERGKGKFRFVYV